MGRPVMSIAEIPYVGFAQMSARQKDSSDLRTDQH